ncbi:serine hydrolase domain-containing protein [Steroidobacter sp.]|uniref:serine hydrolase domain-containing protein n=1 Tax=Steroidobacter sp. TaxID=1978227 RepID=UPI0025E065B3|nr:serine hydrolase domain-containing protein [Steroidobacter sp.]
MLVWADAANAPKQVAVDALFADYQRPGSPGLAVGIYRDGRTVYAHGYGLADLENPVAISADTVFYAASVSKQFVAFAILLLTRDGKIDLDADIRTYLPYVPDFGDRITVRHLIHHTSGLRDQWSLFELGGIQDGSRTHQRQVVNMVKRQRALNARPGTEYNYCNTGYTLLAEIVHAVSGRTLREFTTERIFTPLQMRSTFFYDDASELVPRRARSYEKDAAGRWRAKILAGDTVGGTGLYITANDFARWAANFSRPVVGDAALIEQFIGMGSLDDGTPLDYGFALERKSVAGHAAVLHTGVHGAFRGVFAYFPAEQLSVAILANTAIETMRALERVVTIMLDAKSVESAAAPAKTQPQTRSNASEPEPVPAPATVNLSELVGDYRSSELDATYTLSVENGELLVDSIWFERRFVLRPTMPDGFASDWPLQTVRIERDAAGKPRALLISTARAKNVRFARSCDDAGGPEVSSRSCSTAR